MQSCAQYIYVVFLYGKPHFKTHLSAAAPGHVLAPLHVPGEVADEGVGVERGPGWAVLLEENRQICF